jgi:UDP-GlcNAc:undecaprenyl-phosphate GlcNAc-1-phosphate transferase
MEILKNPIIAGIATFAISGLLTPAVRYFAVRKGFIAAPRLDRWHKRPTAMLGGIAIFLSTLIGYLVFVPKTTESLVIFSAAGWLFLVGLIDDFFNIKPYQKLFGQIVGAVVVTGSGLTLPLTGNQIFDIWITLFWIVGITNAINLLDNMDGLAVGIAAIAAISLAYGLAASGQFGELLFVSVFIGGLLGFLIYNFNPASIFMGDCGSMFVGFLLSTSVLLSQSGGRSRGIFSILAVPFLILFVPIFDTTFVTLLRKLSGKPATQGGRDHTSHRLVALGLSERSAVLLLYGLAIVAGLLAVFVRELPTATSLSLIALFTAALTIIGVYLSKVRVYDETDEERAIRENAVFAFLLHFTHKRRVFEVLLDALLITISYYAAYSILFGPIESGPNMDLFLNTLPLLIIIKLFALFFAGVYRGIWKYTSVNDLIVFFKGVVLGSLLSLVAVLLIYRFQYFSRAVFLLDGVLLFAGIVATRLTFRLLRELIPMPRPNGGRPALIYGAGDGGELVLRELRKNPEWNIIPVGFLDDDPLKREKTIAGLRVYDTNGSIAEICRREGIREIIVSSRQITREKIREIREACGDDEIVFRRAEIRIEPVEFE